MTPARYTLLEYAERSSIVDGRAFETGRRSGDWTFVLNVARVSAGGSVTVALEASPLGLEDTFEEFFAFPAQTAAGFVVVRQRDEGDSVDGPTDRDLYVRAVVKAISGSCILEVLGEAPFFSLEGDLALLPQELREWDDGLARCVEGSEGDVLRVVRHKWNEGRFRANLNDARFLDAMKLAIATQSEHRYRRGRLLESTEPSRQVTARELPDIAPEVYRILAEFLAEEVGVWRGR